MKFNKLTTRLRRKRRKFIPRHIMIASLCLLLVLGPAIFFLTRYAKSTEAAWWDETWQYRVRVPVSNDITEETDVYLNFTGADALDTSDTTRFQADCGDLRFTTEGGQLLSYYIVSGCGTSSTVVHLLLPTFPAGDQNIYYYYGNSSADNGFASSDFSTEATSYTIGTPATEEISPAPVAYYKFDEGYGVTANNSTWQQTGTTTNEITNPSFEHATDWYLFGQWANQTTNLYDDITKTRDTTEKVFGESSGKVVINTVDGLTAQTTLLLYNTTSINASEGETWSASDWVKIESNTGITNVQLILVCRESGGAWVNWSAGNYTTNIDAWEYQNASVTCGANTGNIIQYLYVNGVDNGDAITFYTDGWQLEKQADSTLYCDGDQIGHGSHAWNGTTSASSSTCDTGTDATIKGPTWTSENQCLSGKCLYFDSTDNVSISDTNDNLDFGTGDFTISTWIKTGTIADNRNIVSKGAGAGLSGWRFGIYNGVPNILIGDVDNYVEGGLGTTSIADNEWHLLTVTYDRSASATAYVDGKSVGTLTISTVVDSVDNSSPIIIGNTFATFAGFIDDVKIYPYARTTDQIKADYNARGSSQGSGAVLGSNRQDTLSNGLVGYWQMDETSSPAIDSSGNNISMTWGGNTTSSQGKYGNSTSFDGTTDYLTTTNNFDYSSNAITASAWIYPTESSAARQSIISSKENVSSGFVFHLGQGGTNTLGLYVANGVWSHAVGTTQIPINTWSFATATYDGNDIKIYVNGVLETTEHYPGIITNNSGNTSIGARNTNDMHEFQGSIDEVRIYNRALSPVEVRQLYQYAPGPVGYWDFNEGSGTSLFDKSGNKANGDIVGSPEWTNGKFGKAINFNSTSEYIDIQDNDVFDMDYQLSISAWIKRDPAGLGEWETIIDKIDSGDWEYWLGINSSNQVTLMLNPDDKDDTDRYYVDSSDTSLTDTDNWHYVTGTYDGTNAKIYIDGTLKYTESHSDNVYDGSGNLRVSANSSVDIKGSVDEIKIYNYARTPGQIIQDMNGGHPLGGSPIGSQVAYYKLDEGYGTTANNSGYGSSLNGTLTNNPTWTNDGKFNKALTFSSAGNPQYVSISGSGELIDLTDNDFSFSLWMKPGSTSAGGYQYALSRPGFHTGIYYYDATQKPFFVIWNDSNAQFSASTSKAIPPEQWMHIVGTIETSSKTIKIYVNGKLEGTTTYTGVIRDYGTTNYIIGSGTSSGACTDASRYCFNGSIDQVKIYSTALTPEEVMIDYNQGSGMVLGSLSDTSSLTGGSTASSSASSQYCIPGSSDPCSAPISEWNFNEGTGSYAYDKSGNDKTATWAGTGTHWQSGKVGKAGLFNGSNDYLDLGSGFTGLNGANAFTISTWIYKEEDGNFPGWDGILGIGSTSQRLAWIYGYMNDSILRATFETTTGGANDCAVNSGTITANAWSHIILTWDGTTCQFYINGAPSGTPDTTTGNTLVDTDATNTIGYMDGFTTWNGGIDDLKVYNYARTPAQIALDYNRGAPIAHYKLDECQGTTAHDSSGNGNDGTITAGDTSGSNDYVGTCTGSAGDMWKDGATGKYNSSLEFDGTNDQIDMGDLQNLDVKTNDFSLSTWIKTTSTTNSHIVGKNTWGYSSYGMWLRNTGVVEAEMKTPNPPGTNYQVTSTVINDGSWHHIAASFDRDGYANIYTDGILTDTLDISAAVAEDIDNTGNFLVGKFTAGAFNGQLDDVRIYNYALTDTQVKQVMNEGSALRFGP